MIQTLGEQVADLIRTRDNLQTELDSANRLIELLRTQNVDVNAKYQAALRTHAQEMATLTAERDTANQKAETIHGILMGQTTATMQALRAWRGDQEKPAELPPPTATWQEGPAPERGGAHNHPALLRAMDSEALNAPKLFAKSPTAAASE